MTSDVALKNFDYKMFDVAKKIAEKSNFQSQKMGCVITYKGHIVSKACNTEKTSPTQRYYNRYRQFRNHGAKVLHKLHCEIRALSLISYPVSQNIEWSKVHVYIYRIAPGLPLEQGLARPCPGCIQALKDKGIKHIYYSTNDGFAYEKLEY